MDKASTSKTLIQTKDFTTTTTLMPLSLNSNLPLYFLSNFKKNPYSSNNAIKFLVKTCPIVSFTSNNRIMICFGYQLAPKKFITKAKMSCVPFDMQMLKLANGKITFNKF
jgi:hypothetical protein